MTRRPWWTVKCPVCGEELPERGNRRVYVPWKRSFKLVHDGACADAVDAQGVLDLNPRMRAPAPVSVVRVRRVAELLVRQDERREVTDEDRELVKRVARLLAGEDQPDVARAPQDRPKRLLLDKGQLLDLMRQLAHAPEYSDPTGRLLA